MELKNPSQPEFLARMVTLYIQRLWYEFTEYDFQSSCFRPKDAVLGVLGGLRAVRRGSEAEL